MDDIKQKIINLSAGNPGALTVLCELVNHDPILNIVTIAMIEALKIKGPSIWMLYKDVCGKKIDKTMEVLGEISKDEKYECEIRGQKQNVLTYLRS